MYHKREEQMKRENPKVTQETSKARLQKKLTKIQRMLSKMRLTRGDGNEKKKLQGSQPCKAVILSGSQPILLPQLN